MRKRSAERVEFLSDIITTAVEGGIGYWAEILTYKWVDRPSAVARVREWEAADDGPRKEGELNINTIARGIGRIMKPDFKIRADLKKLIAGASATNDGGDIDVEGADCIVQAAMFGELVYG